MAKRIIYTRPDGGVSIVVPTPETLANPDFSDDADLNAHLLARSIPDDASNVEIVDDTVVPANRTFRSAWRQTGAIVVVNMPAARQLHLQRIRTVRDDVLARTDTDFVRAVEDGDIVEQTRLKTLRQALRDIPAEVQAGIDAAGDPNTLDALWPTQLNRPRIATR